MGPKMRMTQVAHVEDLSPHMRRIILTGTDLHDFPTEQEGAHVKAIFPRHGETQPTLGLYPGAKKWMRSYTIRSFNPYSKALTLDFAVNDHTGLATNWAANTQPGDLLGIAGPGPKKYPNYHADWHLIIADLTALPAAAAALEQLPEDAKGTAIIQVPTNEDIQILKAPTGVKLEWVIGHYQAHNLLLDKVKSVTWIDGQPVIFIATESKHMQEIKQYVKTQPGYQTEKTYASGYWKA